MLDSLETAIAEFLEGKERSELLARYPEFSAELEQFFADHDRMQRLSAPLRGLTSVGIEFGNNSGSTGFDPRSEITIDAAEMEPRGGARSSISGRVGRYNIERELGRGGMGVVYQAHDTQLGRTVALKMISACRFASEADIERFRGEAKLAAGLSHPGIVPIYEADEWQGLPFFTMGLVEGISLAELIRKQPLNPNSAARLLKKIAAAVAFAHANGIIHRDLKPANVLLARNEGSSLHGREGYEPAITDFGLAKRLNAEEHLTTTGQVLGTPAYMSPEQASGSRATVGEASDIYSLGAILYAMLAGRPPFLADSPVEVILQVMETDPPLLQRLNPAIPQEIEAICLKCLEKKPEHRYLSAQALVSDLERFLQQEPPEAGRGSLLRSLRRWGRREPVVAWHLGGIGFILLLVQIIFALHPEREMRYHLMVCLPLLAWMGGCFVLRQMAFKESLQQLVHYLWVAMDTIFLSTLLGILEAPIALLMSSYGNLIVASGLFFRPRLVAFTTLVAIATSIVVFVAQPSARDPLHHAVLFEAILATTGFLVSYQVWRFRVLREYYEEKR